MATPEERLEKVRAAIDQILETGQAVTFGDRSWTAADLKELRGLEAELAAAVNVATRASYRLAATQKGL